MGALIAESVVGPNPPGLVRRSVNSIHADSQGQRTGTLPIRPVDSPPSGGSPDGVS